MSMDTEYLKAAVGNALSTGIAETVLVRPDDPVDYLAQRLLKWVEDSHAKAAAIAAEEEAKDKQVRAADAAAVAEREKKQRRGSTASKVQKEDDRLTKLLDVTMALLNPSPSPSPNPSTSWTAKPEAGHLVRIRVRAGARVSPRPSPNPNPSAKHEHRHPLGTPWSGLG